MTPELQNIRKELYFAMGNCFTGAFVFSLIPALPKLLAMGYALDGRQKEADAAKNSLFSFIQFGVRTKLITPVEGNELLECMRKDGLGSHLVFEKHGHADEFAAALVAIATGGS